MQVVHIKDNEFTIEHLTEYLKRAFGAMSTGSPFTSMIVNRWIQMKKLPDAYGGNKIVNDRKLPIIGTRVIEVEHLNREDIQSVFGDLNEFKETLNKRRAVDKIDGRKKPKKVRTEFYYQVLGKKNQSKVAKEAALPDNWKELGIKANQLTVNKKKKS